MKQKTLKTFSLRVLPLLALIALASASTFAAEQVSVQGATSEQARTQITEAQKALLAQIKTLHTEGKIEEARALAQSSGMHKLLKPLYGGHKDQGKKWLNHENRKKIDEALANKDFAAFKTLIANTPFAAAVNEATFTKLVEAHTLRKAGDKEGSRKIMEELGFREQGKYKKVQ